MIVNTKKIRSNMKSTIKKFKIMLITTGKKKKKNFNLKNINVDYTK